ncbi:MAG: shikimate kinase [Bacteroidota bacterium]|nr:shikimate kinase [Bacteroidota bacterium]
MQRIFLIGFMGSGKTHWGRIWAAKNALSFFDLDAEVEKSFKMTVAEIFQKEGEEKFRELERYHLKKFAAKNNFILSCGGGTPCFGDNLEWMNAEGNVVYLRATPERILKNVTPKIDKRPLLKNVNPSELLFFIEKKLKEREPFYNKARYILDCGSLDEDSLSGVLS